VLFAARAWLLIGLLLPAAFAATALAPGRSAWNVTGWCARTFFRLAGIPLVVRGLENVPQDGTLVPASNHTSYLDGAVVPVALRGGRSALRDGTWYPRRHPIAITFGAPIAPDGSHWNATLRLRDALRAAILKHCGEPDLAPASSKE